MPVAACSCEQNQLNLHYLSIIPTAGAACSTQCRILLQIRLDHVPDIPAVYALQMDPSHTTTQGVQGGQGLTPTPSHTLQRSAHVVAVLGEFFGGIMDLGASHTPVGWCTSRSQKRGYRGCTGQQVHIALWICACVLSILFFLFLLCGHSRRCRIAQNWRASNQNWRASNQLIVRSCAR